METINDRISLSIDDKIILNDICNELKHINEIMKSISNEFKNIKELIIDNKFNNSENKTSNGTIEKDKAKDAKFYNEDAPSISYFT